MTADDLIKSLLTSVPETFNAHMEAALSDKKKRTTIREIINHPHSCEAVRDPELKHAKAHVGWTMLMYAARTGDAALLRTLARLGANNNEYCQEDGLDALIVAVDYGHVEAVKELSIGYFDVTGKIGNSDQSALDHALSLEHGAGWTSRHDSHEKACRILAALVDTQISAFSIQLAITKLRTPSAAFSRDAADTGSAAGGEDEHKIAPSDAKRAAAALTESYINILEAALRSQQTTEESLRSSRPQRSQSLRSHIYSDYRGPATFRAVHSVDSTARSVSRRAPATGTATAQSYRREERDRHLSYDRATAEDSAVLHATRRQLSHAQTRLRREGAKKLGGVVAHWKKRVRHDLQWAFNQWKYEARNAEKNERTLIRKTTLRWYFDVNPAAAAFLAWKHVSVTQKKNVTHFAQRAQNNLVRKTFTTWRLSGRRMRAQRHTYAAPQALRRLKAENTEATSKMKIIIFLKR
jgi:hypothetical protein